MLDNHPRTQLCFIINQYGRIIIDDPRRCRGLLKDLAPNHKRETNVLFLALDEKIVAELAKTNTQIPLAILIERLAHRLHENVGIQKEFAIWAVESWAIALDVIQQPLQKKTNEISMHEVYLAVEAGKVNEAQSMMDKVLRDHPTSAKAHFVEAKLLAKQGQFSNARAELHTAECLQPGLPFAKPQAVQNLKSRIASASNGLVQPNIARQSIPKIAIKQVKSAVYKLGDVLSDGSIIFHVDASGRHGMAAQSVDEEERVSWKDALRLAREHGQGWHLPTKDELNLLYQQKDVVGGFATINYWSSTEYNSNFAWTQSFYFGNQYYNNKSYTLPVRAVRAF